MNLSDKWTDYEILATGNGMKLERFGNIILNRPDPQIIWDKTNNPIWNTWDGYYHRSTKGGGYWEFKKKLPEYWTIKYRDLTFKVSPTNFKHTGIFPEQATNWDYITEKIKSCQEKEIRILNLFAYTGCATMVASHAGADEVVHVDASKGMVDWAKENMKLSKLEDKFIRFINDDCLKFVEREARRGNKYDAIIMDPPSYGRGANGEVWDIEKNLNYLIELCMEILSDEPLFFLINSYTTGLSSHVLENILKLTIDKKYSGKITCGEVGLPIKENDLVLPCGIYGRWESNE